jgi:hypothetical protein
MKTILLLLLLSPLACAQVGKGYAQTCAKYSGGTDGLLVSVLKSKGVVIEVIKDQGVVDFITYQKRTRPPDSKPVMMTLVELKGFLSDNISAGAWEKTGNRSWKHTKERKLAFYVDSECRLYVWENIYVADERFVRWREIALEVGPQFITDSEIERHKRIQSVVCNHKS